MIKEIEVEMRLVDKSGSAVKAVCDVFIRFEELGAIDLHSFRVLQNGRGVWVSPPARKGERRWFDVVTLRGPFKCAVEAAILREFERLSHSSRES